MDKTKSVKEPKKFKKPQTHSNEESKESGLLKLSNESNHQSFMPEEFDVIVKGSNEDTNVNDETVSKPVAMQQNDSSIYNSELYDFSESFKSIGVYDEICDNLKKLGYKNPTKIQKETLQYALKGRDLIGLAETGSGKTAAFGIPIIQKLLDNMQPYFGLILAPTRELCLQISEHLEAIGANLGLKTSVLVGGLDSASQAISLSKFPHIIIGTPGRVFDHLQNTKNFSLKNLKFLVFDEADKLLDLDFEQQIISILSVIPKNRTTFLFSATMTSKVQKLQKASLADPVKIEVNSKYQTVSTLIQNYLFIPARYKECYLAYLLTELTGKTAIVFMEKCLSTIRMAILLRNLGFKAISINGKMTQSNRIGALNKFKSGDRNILIATDVASRGIDIPGVDIVINYDLPQQSKDYIHRVGRTARAGKAGLALTLVTQYDVESYQKIEHVINKRLEAYKIEEDQVLQIYERVCEAIRFSNQELKEITKKLKTADSLVETNPDEDNDEGDPFRTFVHKKKKIEFNQKSFVKKKGGKKKHK